QTWTGAVNGSWSNAANWSGGIPFSNINTQLTFGLTSNAAMMDDIIGTLILNRLTFNSGSPAYTLTGNALDFRTNSSAVLPSITMNAANPVIIGNALTLTNDLTVNGFGNGTVRLNGSISGLGSLTYSGGGTFTLGNASNT